jgi:hypothetical protein
MSTSKAGRKNAEEEVQDGQQKAVGEDGVDNNNKHQ